MCGLDCCGKAILIIINIFFQIIGFTFLAAGVFLKVGTGILASSFNIDALMGQIPDIAGSVNIAGVTAASNATPILNIGDLFGAVAVVLIVLGVFILLLGCFGCCGACCTIKVCLIVYAVILIILFLVKLIIVICFASGAFDPQMRGQLNDTIVTGYGGISTFNAPSLAWNIAMVQYKCCGLDGYKDFDYATNWERTRSFTYSGYTVTKTMITPVACCVVSGTFPAVTPTDTNCTFNPTDVNNNWKTGCWDAVWKEFASIKTITFAVIGGILAFEALCFGLAICLMVRSAKEVSPV